MDGRNGAARAGSALACGLAMLHYVNFDDIAHHREWAIAHGLPEPSFGIGVAGAAATALGGFVLGLAVARRRGTSARA